jgi:hypothetical protein
MNRGRRAKRARKTAPKQPQKRKREGFIEQLDKGIPRDMAFALRLPMVNYRPRARRWSEYMANKDKLTWDYSEGTQGR